MKVCVVLVDRANYGRLKPVMRELSQHPRIELQVVCGGSMVLNRFGRTADIVRRDGFNVDEEFLCELEGSTFESQSASQSLAQLQVAPILARLNPDYVVLIGDRYEAVGVALAAVNLGICLVHFQGGEQSGNLDNKYRDVITKLADYHVPATAKAAERLYKLGENRTRILTIGCPYSDLAKEIETERRENIVCVYHPCTTDEPGIQRMQMSAILQALVELREPTVLLWPNIDAGADDVSKAIRHYRENYSTDTWLTCAKNMAPEAYAELIANAAVCVGNSSSFVRDAGFWGTPVVLTGGRQVDRECGGHVVQVPCAPEHVKFAIVQQRKATYPKCTLYGDGQVSERFVAALVKARPVTTKRNWGAA